MNNIILMVNNIIEFLDEKKSVRILWISTDYSYCYTIDMNTELLRINKRKIQHIEECLERGIAVREKDSKHSLRTERNISQSDVDKLKKAKEKIDFILENCSEPYIYQIRYRGEVIRKTIEKLGGSKASIYKYVRKYLQGGRATYSLLPDYYNCGGRNKPKKVGEKKIGRPNLQSQVQQDREGVNVSEDTKKKFINAINKYYKNDNEIPLTEVYDLMIEEDFCTEVMEDGEYKKKQMEHYQIPTIRQFRYWCENLVEIVELMKKRKGDKEFKNNYEGLKSDSREETFGPCFKAQIDAKICNVQIVNRLRNKVIGKPVRYFVVDQFSSYIMGLYVGLDSPSWNGASSAIFNCIEDKVEFCGSYGIAIKADEWINSTLPKVLLADRGPEFSGKLLNYAVENLGIIVQNTQAFTARNKGIVEQSFNTTEMKMRTLTPGAPKGKFINRGERVPQKDAKYTIEDITRTYISIVINHNNKVCKNHPHAGELIKEGIVPTPLNIYMWGLKKYSGALREYDIDFVKLNLMRRGVATVTEKGIKDGERYYDCERAITENWYTKARIGKSWKVDICYDARRMNNIYIIGAMANELEICTLREGSSFYKDSSYEEVLDFEKHKTICSNTTYIDHKNHNNLVMNERLKDIKESVLREPNDDVKKYRPSKKDISESRKEENSTYRQTQALSIVDEVGLDNIPHEEAESGEENSNNYLVNKIKKIRNRGVEGE